MNAAPQRIAAVWFLAAVTIALFVFLWLRGAGRIVVPLVIVTLVGVGVARVVRAVLRPVD